MELRKRPDRESYNGSSSGGGQYISPSQILRRSIEKYIAKTKREKPIYVSTGGGTAEDIISYRQDNVHFKVRGEGPQLNKSVDCANGLRSTNAEILQRYIEVKRVQERSVERRAANGNYVANAFGQERIGRPRYINESIELELIDFKIEIEEKFAKSKVNRDFRFPLMRPEPVGPPQKLFVEILPKPHALRYAVPEDSYSSSEESQPALRFATQED